MAEQKNKSNAILHKDELIEYFEDDTYKDFNRTRDDGSISSYGWCCDFEIVENEKVILRGVRGDGLCYCPKSKTFYLEKE